MDVIVEAFNATFKNGSLSCSTSSHTCADGTGVLNGTSINGWPIPFRSSSANLSLTATSSLALNYSCWVKAFKNNRAYDVPGEPAFLQVRVLPSTPVIGPNPTTFNQSDDAAIICKSRKGIPEPIISLTVMMPNGTMVTRTGISNSSLTLPFPSMDWHNSTATCNVTNHNVPNTTVTTRVLINHVRSIGFPDDIPTSSSTVTLNCAAYVRSYPGVLYSWQASIGANATVNRNPSNASWDVLPGQWGSFICTATNTITAEYVTIPFTVSNVTSTSTASSPGSVTNIQSDSPLWVIGVVLRIAVVVVIGVVLGVLCKRVHFSKGLTDASSNDRQHSFAQSSGRPAATSPQDTGDCRSTNDRD